ncbi:MAG: hypothetical protein HYT07_01940 [Candidatus Levybacteria bacterium]|nr:hypothetical protein [Candidatus Levybacteria bacterium]
MKARLISLIIFSIAFAFVEATVVFYLREIFHISNTYVQSNYKTLLNLGVIAFILPDIPILNDAKITAAELQREAATMIMLASLAFLSAEKWKQRLGAFLIAFGVWDIFYYIFLKYLTGWPKTLFDVDVYFLIPIAWVGPVITPIAISLLIIILGLKLYKSPPDKH